MKRGTLFSLLGVGLVLLACRVAPPGIPTAPAPTSSPLPAALPSLSPSPTPTEAPRESATEAPAGILEPVTLIDQVRDEKDPAGFYTLELRYPQLEVELPSAGLFNASLEKDVAVLVEQFKRDAVEPTGAPADLPPSGFHLTYEVFYNQGGLISLQLQYSVYIRGAAHPYSATDSITYDLRASRVLALPDLFRAGSGYLERIAAACTADLQTRGFPVDTAGAEPRLENYRSWNVAPDGLRVTFDPYQVAAYAAGPQIVLLDWALFSDLLNPAVPFTPSAP